MSFRIDRRRLRDYWCWRGAHAGMRICQLGLTRRTYRLRARRAASGGLAGAFGGGGKVRTTLTTM